MPRIKPISKLRLLTIPIIFAWYLLGCTTAYAAPHSLLSYWKFDDGPCSATASDSTGSNAATLTNMCTTNDWVCGAGPGTSFTNTHVLDFDGCNDYLNLPSFPNQTAGGCSFSVSAWVRTTNNAEAGQRIFADDQSNTQGFAISIGDPGTGRIRFFWRGMSGIVLDSSASVICSNTWHHVTAVADRCGDIRRLYVDGTQVAVDLTDTGSASGDAGPSSIGGETDSGETANRFRGRLDDVRFYQRVLTPQEISELACGDYTTAVWNGGTSTNFCIGSNWEDTAGCSIEGTPDPYTNVIINNAACDPILNSNTTIIDLTMNACSQFDLNGFDLTFNECGKLTMASNARLIFDTCDQIKCTPDLNLNGGVLELDASATGTVSLDFGTVTLGANSTIDVEGAGDTLCFGDTITECGGSFRITKDGCGTLILNNNNNAYSGGTVVNAGTLQASQAGEITLAAGATNACEDLLGTGSITVNGGTATIQSTGNEIEIDGSITVNCGTLNLTSCTCDLDFDECTTVLDINGGTVNLTAGDDIFIDCGGSFCISDGNVNVCASDDFVVQCCSSVTISGGTTTVCLNDQFIVDGSSTLTQTGGTLNVNTCDNVEFDGAVTVSGCGTTATFNASTRTRWDDGSLTVSNGARVITQGGDAIFIDSASLNGGACATKGTLEVQCANLIIGNTTTVSNCVNITMNTAGTHCLDLDQNGTLCNVGTFTKTGTGTVNINDRITTLDANNIVISNGTIALQDNEQIVDTADLNLAGGTLQMSANDGETVNDLSITSSSAIVFDTQSDLTVENFDLTAGQTLTITGWTTFTHYTTGQGAGTSLRVDQVPGTYNINNISVNGTTGVFDFMDGGDGYYYLVLTTPEPSTYISIGAIALLITGHFLRRKSKV